MSLQNDLKAVNESNNLDSKSNCNRNWLLIIFLILLGVVIICFIIYISNKSRPWFRLDTYIEDDPKLNELRNIFNKFWKTPRKWKGDLDILNHRDLTKEVKIYKGDKSYTINKKEIFMCLTDENGKYYPTNMLIYVLAHEFAHVISVSIGHTSEFHDKFDQLLDVLIKDGIYDPSEEIILDYCQH